MTPGKPQPPHVRDAALARACTDCVHGESDEPEDDALPWGAEDEFDGDDQSDDEPDEEHGDCVAPTEE